MSQFPNVKHTSFTGTVLRLEGTGAERIQTHTVDDIFVALRRAAGIDA